MPTPSIVNPTGAFGAPVLGPGLLLDGGTYIEMVAGAAITAGQSVGFVVSTGLAVPSTTALAAQCLGVALDTVATGAVVRIVNHGILLGLCIAQSGGVTGGTVYSPADTGTFTTASATIGNNIIVAMTTASAAATFNVYVQKM